MTEQPLEPLEPLEIRAEARSKKEPVVIVGSILAGAHVLFAGWAGIQILADHEVAAAVGALGNLATAAAQVGLSFWVRGQVTPNEDVEPLLPVEGRGGVNGF